mgnify:CR=1 FL=1
MGDVLQLVVHLALEHEALVLPHGLVRVAVDPVGELTEVAALEGDVGRSRVEIDEVLDERRHLAVHVELGRAEIRSRALPGFGRLGAWTGSELYGVVPDILTTAKGITNAAVPLG